MPAQSCERPQQFSACLRAVTNIKRERFTGAPNAPRRSRSPPT
jgi:hypothetical protein